MSACLFMMSLCFAQVGSSVVAEVGGTPITTEALQLQLALRGVTGEPSARLRARIVEDLVERALVGQFLKSRKTDASAQQLALAVDAAKEALAEQGYEGLDEELLSRQLALPLAWQKHVRRVVTEKQIRDYYQEHQRELDGTRLRVSQIFLKYANGEDEEAAPETTARLKRIRESIASEATTFAEAAKRHSEAPTAKSGGNVGWIGPHGSLPEAVTGAAFALETGEMSDVVFSPFGAHLVTVTETEPGMLSLEDVRPEILGELSRKLWKETVAAERAKTEVRVVGQSNDDLIPTE